MTRHLGASTTLKCALMALVVLAVALVSGTSGAVVIYPAYDGYITSPLAGTAVTTTDSLRISGLAHNPNAGTAPMSIEIYAYDYDSQAWDYMTTATIAANATPVMTVYETMYAWSATLSLNNVGTQYEYWLPTFPYPSWYAAPAFESSQGRLALMAVGNGPRSFGTFDRAGAGCLAAAGNTSALYNCASGDDLVVFYQPGVTQSAVSYSTWTPVAGNGTLGVGPFVYSPPGLPKVTWEVESYVVDEYTVYNLLCEPVDTRPAWERYLFPPHYPVQVYNHGGFSGISGTFDNTNQDKTDDPLGICLSAAQNGWLAVASSYRGEKVEIGTASNPSSDFDKSGVDAQVEYCLGEVTDVLALLKLVLQRGDVDSTHVLMWGWSHGGCVTMRAVQQGAAVQAAATFSAMADDALYYNAMCSPEEVRLPESTCAAWDTLWGALHGPAPNAQSSQNSPDQMPAVYAWRDPAAFEGYQEVSGWIEKSPYAGISYRIGAPGDLQRRRDVPFLMLSGGQDTFIDVDQTCEISATLGSAASNWVLVDNGFTSSTGSRPVCSQLTWYSAPGNAAWDAGASLAETNWNLVWSESGQHGLMSNGTAWGVFSAFVNERLAWGPTVPSTPLQSASGDNNP